MLSAKKSVSLVQLKKQQWAREREEMSKCYVPWAPNSKHYQQAWPGSSRMEVQNQFASSLELHKQSSYQYHEDQPIQRQRSPSLPPIRKQNEYCIIDSAINHTKSIKNHDTLDRNILNYENRKFSNYEEDCEGDTSGYASDNFHNFANGSCSSSSYHQNRGEHQPVIAAWQNKPTHNNRLHLSTEAINRAESEVVKGRLSWSPQGVDPGPCSGDEARPRWGDRGVATGKLWEPQDPSARLPQMQVHKKGTPAWVERGLNMTTTESIPSDVLIIDQHSNHSGIVECDRSSYTGSDGEKNTYLRGQNAPVEPEVKVQRENRRLKALEIQSIILSQLEERDRLKREVRTRRIREEQEEEMRIKRQQEEDLKRLEDERRRSEEKREMERKKIETLRMAIEEAEIKAKLDKEYKRKTSRRLHDSLEQNPPNLIYSNQTTPPTEDTKNITGTNNTINLTNNGSSRHNSPRKSVLNTTFDRTSRKNSNEYRSNEQSSQNTSQMNTPRSSQTDNMKMFLPGGQIMNLYPEAQVNLVPIALTHDMLSSNSPQPNSLQFALLLRQNNSLLYSLQQPIALNSNVLVHLDDNIQTEKILTPRKYRNPKSRDAFTQTDPIDHASKVNRVQEKSTDTGDKVKHKIDKDYQNIDENAPLEVQTSNSIKKERRFRSEERYKKEMDNRPKWGVNRPAAQYKKQSEKDPFYIQKRKLRQRQRPDTQRYLYQSSEDSRSPSPPTQSDKMSSKDLIDRQSLSRSHWHNKRIDKDETFKLSNATVETVNIQTLESIKTGQIFIRDEISETQHRKIIKESPIKRITLSQKFINDKYGNRKLWQEDGTCDEINCPMDNTLVPLFTKNNRKIDMDRTCTGIIDNIVDIKNDNVVFKPIMPEPN